MYYTEDWRGEMTFNTTDTKPYEYACHEGNYGLTGILAGARRSELSRPATEHSERRTALRAGLGGFDGCQPRLYSRLNADIDSDRRTASVYFRLARAGSGPGPG